MSLSDGRVQLTDELEKEGMLAMKKIGAYIGTNGDPRVMDSFKEPTSMFYLFLITGGLALVAYMIAEISNFQEIKRNWSHYRCMPSIAPFSKFYGHDLAETMNFCVSQTVKEHAPGVIDPIFAGINKVTGIVDGVYDKVVSIEGGVAGLLKGFETFMVNFVNSFRLLGVRVRMSFVRIKDIFARVYGLFIAFAYAAISAITFGENLICNPLVVFLGTITGNDICCFAPETPIRMADGSVRPISQIAIGDQLAGGSEVGTTYLFDGSTTKMVQIHGVHVSANHYLPGPDGAMIQAGEHPDAREASRLTRLWCLATTNNRIPVVTNMNTTELYADYEESSDPAVIAEAQRIAEEHLNGGAAGPTVPDYSLGLDPSLLTFMKNSTWKPLSQIQIGDELMGGGIVIGLVREVCEEQCMSPGGHYVSAAQLIGHGDKWVRAAHIWPAIPVRQSILYHVMLSVDTGFTVGGDGEVFNVRDYAEITALDIQKPYDRDISKQKDC